MECVLHCKQRILHPDLREIGRVRIPKRMRINRRFPADAIKQTVCTGYGRILDMKKVLAFICVLALVLSLCSVFSFAAAPEAEAEVVEAGDNVRSPNYCYTKTRTKLYAYTNGDHYYIEIPSGTQLEILSGHTTERKHVRTMDGQYEGYVLRAHIIETG